MQIHFLGTSSGTPTKQRNVSAVALQAPQGKRWCLIDCGEGTQHQLLRTRLSLYQLEAIFITHMHGDHCYGLPGLLGSASLSGRTRPLTLVGPAPLRGYVEAVLNASSTHLTFAIDFIEVEPLGAVFSGPGFVVNAWELSHRIPSFAYQFVETAVDRIIDSVALQRLQVPRGPAWGQLKRGESVTLDSGVEVLPEQVLAPPRPARIVVVADDNDRPELLAEACTQAQVLVHEATYLAEDWQAPVQHSSVRMVAEFADSVALPNLLLTHFSARYGPEDMLRLRGEAEACYRGQLQLAEDFQQYQLHSDGALKRVTSA